MTTLARRAYRRPVTAGEVKTLLGFYEKGREGGGNFDTGIQTAITRILVTLEKAGFLERAAGTGRYRVGIAACGSGKFAAHSRIRLVLASLRIKSNGSGKLCARCVHWRGLHGRGPQRRRAGREQQRRKRTRGC